MKIASVEPNALPENILFDLDGTLTDPFVGITRCIQYALEAMEAPVPEADELRWCIGPPLKHSFGVLLQTEDSAVQSEGVAKYRERFATIGLFENEVYDGIAGVLDELTRRGHRCFVATSKPRVYACQIIAHFGLEKYFTTIHGSELDGTRSDKTALLAYILEQEKLVMEETAMIGDRSFDMRGARENNLLSVIGVSWGYGDRDELMEAGASWVIDSPDQLIG